MPNLVQARPSRACSHILPAVPSRECQTLGQDWEGRLAGKGERGDKGAMPSGRAIPHLPQLSAYTLRWALSWSLDSPQSRLREAESLVQSKSLDLDVSDGWAPGLSLKQNVLE